MLSYVHGADATPLLGKTIGQSLDDAARQWGSASALISRQQSINMSWEDLRLRSEALAAGLIARGLKVGDRIGIWALNQVEWTVTQFAAAKAGLILVTINPAYRLWELEFALKKVSCKALVIGPPSRVMDYAAILSQLAPELLTSLPEALRLDRLPALRLVIQMGSATLPGAVAFDAVETSATDDSRRTLRATEACLQFDDPINIQFTSGTTGSPKGVTLSHFNILNNAYFVGSALGLSVDDRVCIPVPLYHCFGMVVGNLCCLAHGSVMVYPGEVFNALDTLSAIAAERCTVLYGVPTMFIAELDHPRFSEFDLTSLRTGIMAGSPCPIEVMRRVNDRMHMGEVTICYGMTETSPTSFQSARTDSLEHRTSTVGRVHPHVEAKVVDSEGRIVERGTVGEVCTRGYSVMLGYWDEADQTAEVKDTSGWMHTGDLGALDDLGYLTISGRIKDLVIRGGENLYPREIEDFLHTHTAIRDVQVLGVPDKKYGEELCAWIILQEADALGDAEVRAFCKEQIAHQKIPKYIRFVDAFPMTVTGKVQKFKMREIMEAELGLRP